MIVVGVLIGLYVASWATSFPKTVAASSSATTTGVSTHLTLQTVAAVGPKYSPAHPDWVSYLVQSNGKWIHSTDYKVPANSDRARHRAAVRRRQRPAQPVPLAGPGHGRRDRDGRRQDGQRDQPRRSLAHLRGAGTRASSCRCRASRKKPRTSANSRRARWPRPTARSPSRFRTGKKGRYHWQCFVPCAAGFLTGGGGPMQTLGYMDGFLDVV